MTDYIILVSDPNDANEPTWGEVGNPVKASSAQRALAAAGVAAGEYVAIPLRSWKPMTVKTEQVTKVTIG